MSCKVVRQLRNGNKIMVLSVLARQLGSVKDQTGTECYGSRGKFYLSKVGKW